MGSCGSGTTVSNIPTTDMEKGKAKHIKKRKRAESSKSFTAEPVGGRGITGNKTMLKVQRSVTYSRVSASGAGEVDTAYSFQLSDLPNYTEFTNLFDEYRIDKVTMVFYPDTQDATPASGTGNTVVYSVLDYDDANAIAISALEQYDTMKTHNGLKPWGRSVVPRFAVAAYAGTFTSYSSKAGWVDCNSAGVQHYGIKIAFPLQAGNANTWTPVATFYMSFRKTR